MGSMFLASGHGACGKGTSAADVAAVEIECGFKPKYVQVVAIDTNCVKTEWQDGMDAGKGVQIADDTGLGFSQLSANGISVNDRGFVIGTGCQVSSKAYYWMAFV